MENKNKDYRMDLAKILNFIENKPLHVTQQPKEFNLYDKFKDLPSHAYLSTIYEIINKNRLVTVSGPTGCGKTCGVVGTFITEWEKYTDKEPYNFICSIPTITATRKMFTYLSSLFDNNPIIGWSAGGEINYKDETKVILATTQHVVNYLIRTYQQNRKKLRNLVVMIDEAHYPTVENYVLIRLALWLKQEARLRVIIASATLTSGIPSEIINNYSQVEISISRYEVKELYHHRTFELKEKNNLLKETAYQTIKLIKDHVGALVFVSGEAEANIVVDEIKKINNLIKVSPIYGNMPQQDIDEILKHNGEEKKIIVATNIAETSITLPFVSLVVDTCLCKKIKFKNGVTYLVEEYYSQDNGTQRKGRAGRVKNGVCYRMMTKNDYMKLNDHDINQFYETPPYEPVLMLLANSLLPEKILKIDSDVYKDVINKLKKLSLINKQKKVTKLGKSISRYPLNLENAIVVEKASNKKLELFMKIIIIISMVESSSSSPLFWYPWDKRKGDEMYEYQEKYFDKFRGLCDLSTLFNVFIEYLNDTKLNRRYTGSWAYDNSLNHKTLKQATQLISNIFDKNKIPFKKIYDINNNKINNNELKEIYKLIRSVYSENVYELKKSSSNEVIYEKDDKKYYVDPRRNINLLFDNSPSKVYALNIYVFEFAGGGMKRFLNNIFPKN